MRMYVHVRMYVYMYARNVHTYAFVLQMHHLYVIVITALYVHNYESFSNSKVYTLVCCILSAFP